MNKKIIISVIVVLIIVLIIGGYFLISSIERNKLKNYLDGIYVTSKEYMPTENDERAIINVITFYPNNTFSIYGVEIRKIENIGVEVLRGETTTGTYVLSNESKSILLTSLGKSETYTYENDYKTLKGANKEYNLLESSIEDYIPKDTLKDRSTDFSGKYVYENIVDYVPGMIYHGARKNEEPLKIVTRYTLEFLNDGTMYQRTEEFNIYASDNDEVQTVSTVQPLINYYGINKENGEIFVYWVNGRPSYSYSPYEKYTISNDLKEITNNRGDIFKLIEL